MARSRCHALALLSAIGLFVLACNASGPNRRQEQSNVNEQLRRLSAHPDLEVVIRTGIEHWRAGQITLSVHGDGRAVVTQRQAGITRSFQATLDRDEADAFARELSERRFTAQRTSTMPREPGDTPVHLALLRAGELVLQIEVWSADRDEDADLDAILIAASKLVHRVTEGQLGSL